MKAFPVGVDALGIFSIVPKLADASSPVFFAKGIFHPLRGECYCFTADQVGQVNQAQSLDT